MEHKKEFPKSIYAMLTYPNGLKIGDIYAVCRICGSTSRDSALWRTKEDIIKFEELNKDYICSKECKKKEK